MFKAFLLFIITGMLSSGVVAAHFQMNHEWFVHLPEKEKEAVIIKTMEFMVELESKYKYASIHEGVDSPNAQKYAKILKQIQSFFISEAYALPEVIGPRNDPDIIDYSRSHSALLGTAPPRGSTLKKCFYGGWLSLTTDGQCVHPARVARLHRASPEHAAYKRLNTSCVNPNPNEGSKDDKIACNPAIFGFKNKQAGSQFCVAAGYLHESETSLNCMKLALGLIDEQGADSKEVRLAHLKSQFATNKEFVNDVFNFVAKTCICDSQTANENFSKVYIDKVKPERTCYALLNMISNTYACEIEPIQEFNFDLLKRVREMKLHELESNEGFKRNYSEELSSFESRYNKDFRRICYNEKPAITCSVVCNQIDGSWVCDKPVDSTGRELTTKEVEVPTDDSKTQLKIKLDTDEEIMCNTSFVAQAAVEPTLPENAKTVCAISGPAEDDKTSPSKLTVTITADTQEVEVETERKWSSDETNKTLEISVEKTAQEQKISFSTQVKKGDLPLPVTCEFTLVAKAADPEAPTLELNVKATEKTIVKLEAVVTNEKDGWVIKWHRQSSAATPAANASGIRLSQSESEISTAITTTSAAPEVNKVAIENDGKKTYSAPREAAEYKVCAHLENGDQKVSEKCKKIAAKEAEAAAKPTPRTFNAAQPMPNQGPQMPRGSSNTSAQGIR